MMCVTSSLKSDFTLDEVAQHGVQHGNKRARGKSVSAVCEKEITQTIPNREYNFSTIRQKKTSRKATFHGETCSTGVCVVCVYVRVCMLVF